ncbi:hypothetical protein VKT23_004437 [Stygiomarasmius scandens]|uniref:DUF3835 domain-containing protein n=1 Tax=Marasmiellus scandens TaxID=2682957 RepID=A0ABR1JX08_9AGAR
MAASSNEAALQTLFRSFAGEGSQNVTPETIEQLSNRLSELLGEDVVRDAFANGGRGAERFNEEGLPIVDINEPGTAPVPTNRSLLDEPTLVPLTSLSPAERERRRIERDRILDLLEEEETLEQRREEERERLERLEAAEKRKEAAKVEKEHLKMARETQKKMGKALLRGLSNDESETSQQKPGKEKEAGQGAKKSVSFAAESTTGAQELQGGQDSEKIDWGDVAIGRLRAARQLPSLLSQNYQNEQLMKASVVERIPGVGTVNAVPATTQQADSDDESDVDADDVTESSVDLEEEEFDADFAQQQREVALEYHRKRGKIGEAAATALTSHSHTPDEEPLADLSSSKAKPSISNFRANQLASSYAASAPSSSQSLGGSVLPASGTQTLQRSIRMGKLDSENKLVGGDAGESDSEPDNEATQEMVELLQKGQVYNVGPNGDLHTIPSSSQKSADVRAPQPFTPPTQPLSSKPKTSQFKLSRPQVRAPNVVDPFPISEAATPISIVGRSSPKLPPISSSVVERSVSGRNTPVSTVGRSSPKLPPVGSSVVEQPVSGKNTPIPPVPSPAMTIIESPSFQRQPDFSSSMIIESPSFPQNPRSSSRPERPPVIMSKNVRESVPKSHVVAGNSDDKNGEEVDHEPPKKVSRFKAERM